MLFLQKMFEVPKKINILLNNVLMKSGMKIPLQIFASTLSKKFIFKHEAFTTSICTSICKTMYNMKPCHFNSKDSFQRFLIQPESIWSDRIKNQIINNANTMMTISISPKRYDNCWIKCWLSQ